MILLPFVLLAFVLLPICIYSLLTTVLPRRTSDVASSYEFNEECRTIVFQAIQNLPTSRISPRSNIKRAYVGKLKPLLLWQAYYIIVLFQNSRSEETFSSNDNLACHWYDFPSSLIEFDCLAAVLWWVSISYWKSLGVSNRISFVMIIARSHILSNLTHSIEFYISSLDSVCVHHILRFDITPVVKYARYPLPLLILLTCLLSCFKNISYIVPISTRNQTHIHWPTPLAESQPQFLRLISMWWLGSLELRRHPRKDGIALEEK